MAKKLRIPSKGTKLPALTQLKQRSAEDRAEVMRWCDVMTSKQVRAHIQKRWKIVLRSDSQITHFRKWQEHQVVWDRFLEAVEHGENFLADKMPDVSRDTLREIAIKRAYAVSAMVDDAELALKVIEADLKDSADHRDWEKLELLKKKAAQADKARRVANSKKLTPEEKAEKLKAIFQR